LWFSVWKYSIWQPWQELEADAAEQCGKKLHTYNLRKKTPFCKFREKKIKIIWLILIKSFFFAVFIYTIRSIQVLETSKQTGVISAPKGYIFAWIMIFVLHCVIHK
jgi:hypothetical protein